MHGHPCPLQYLTQFGCIFSNQDDGADKLLNGYTQWGEILPFTFTAQYQHDATICPHAIDGCDSSAHIGAFAVVDVFNILQNGNRRHTMGFATVFAQGIQHGSQWRTRCTRQCQRRHGIECVMASTDTQGIYWQ